MLVPATAKVPVTEEEAATKPPKNWAVVVVKLPRAVTDWRVSRPEAAGQLVPFERQTEIPFTKIAVEVTVFAERVSAFSVDPVALVKLKLVMVPVVARRLVEKRFAANKLVVVVLMPVALVNVTPARVETPVTLRVPVAVMLEAVSPPNKVNVVVVKLPRLDTVWRVSASATDPVEQNCPLERQIPCPATVAVAKEAMLAFNVLPVAAVNESNPVEAKFVAVVF